MEVVGEGGVGVGEVRGLEFGEESGFGGGGGGGGH